MDVEELRQRGKDMIDFICNYYETLPSRRAYPDVEPGFMAPMIPTEPPKKPDKWSDIMRDVRDIIIPGLTHWNHPHFHAYFPNSQGTAGLLSSLLMDAFGCLGFTWASSPSLTELEEIMMDWMAKAYGLPSHFLFTSPNSVGGGAIQTSASECVFVCMIAARAQAIEYLKDKNPGVEMDDAYYLSKLRAYSSAEAHSCLEKAAKLAMVKLRILDTDEECSLRGPTLAEAIEEDIKQGLHPFFVSCTLGSTSSVAFDNLKEIGPICIKLPALWLHVDGAYAGNGFICPEMRYLKEGLEFADSYNTNPNKWAMMAYDCSLMWVKDRYKLTTSLTVDPLYLRYNQMNIATDYRHWGIPLSRRFRALKVFFVMRDLGIEGIQAKIRNDCKLAKEFEKLVLKDSRFEICNNVRAGLVAFRLKASDEINQDLLASLNREGKIHLVPCKIKEKFVLRFCVIHPESDLNLIQASWTVIQDHATDILSEMPQGRRASGPEESRRLSFVLSLPPEVFEEATRRKSLKDDALPVLVLDDSTAGYETPTNRFDDYRDDRDD